MRILRNLLLGIPFLIIGQFFDNWGAGWLSGIAWYIIQDIVNKYYELKAKNDDHR